MSLINDMLRNLEAKRPDDLARQNLQREIRALPEEVKRGRSGVSIVVSTLLAAIGIGAAVLQADGRLMPMLGIPPDSKAVPVAAPPLPVTPAAPPAVAVEPPPTVDPKIEPIIDQLRMASNLEVLPLPAAPVLPVPDPLPLAAPSTSKTEAEPVKAHTSGPVKIEKSAVAATAHDRADAEYRKAENALAAGRSAEALEGLREALKIDPGYVQVRQALLRRLIDLHKTDDAMVVLRDGLDAQPMQTGWAMSLARLQLEHGDLTAADRTLSRSQAYAEANPDYAGFQGHLKSRLGAQRLAAAHYQRATRLAPNEGRWWLGLGLALEADAHPGEAKEAFRRAQATGSLSADLATIAEQHLRQ